MERRERQHADQELAPQAEVLAKRFIQRWDLHARQLDNGHYICIHKPLKVNHILAHLRGDITLGTYLLDRNSQARFIVFDADDEQGFMRLAFLSRTLAEDGVPSYLERSRRGAHLWFFLAEAETGRDARSFGRGVVKVHGVDNVEIFPKQDKLSSGPGSLIRLPFGVHRLAECRFEFFSPSGEPLAATIHEQILMLSSPQIVSDTAFDAYRSCKSLFSQERVLDAIGSPKDTVSERIKARVTVLEFVSQYIDLKPVGNGALGLCPFHDDHRPSFGVNDRENYWHCFAGCGGGSVIDFWMKWRACDFTYAVTELAHILL